MLEYQKRVIAEKDALDTRIKNLKGFLDSEFSADVPQLEMVRMRDQLYYMQEYSNVLSDRIEYFKEQG